MTTAIRIWREASQRLTQDVAREAGVAIPTWNRWENGRRRVPAERVLDVERVTGISRHELRPDLYGPALETAG